MKARLILSILFLGGIIAANGQTPEPASAILDKAFSQAAKENKNVLVIFHASWCIWCKRFEASVNDPSCKDYFDRNYVIRELTVLENGDNKKLENPGAIDIYNSNAGSRSGIPYFIIYDSKGRILADSKIKPAGAGPDARPMNMGCPSQDDEVAAFTEILKKTSKITDREVAAVSERFKKNKPVQNHQ